MKLKLVFLFLVLNILGLQSASANYWAGKSDVVAAEMAFQDVCMEAFAPTTYYAFWHTYLINNRTKQDVSFFYGGSDFNDQRIKDFYYATNYVWTFWHLHVTPLWARHGFGRSWSVGEGASARIGGPYKILPKRWYRHVIRFWSPGDEKGADTTTYVGWWMKDLDGDGQWHLIGTCSIPAPDIRFKGAGLGGFIENFGASPADRTQSFRNLYTRKDGQWVSAGWRIEHYDPRSQRITYDREEKSVRYDIFDKPVPGAEAGNKPASIDLEQNPTPPMGSLEIGSLTAHRFGPNVVVEWDFAEHSTPQLHAKIELLDSDERVVATEISDLPFIKSTFLDLSSSQSQRAHAVRITAFDIFDQKTQKIVNLKRLTTDNVIGKPTELAESAPGFKIEFYELPGAKSAPAPSEAFANWNSLPSLDGLTLVRTAFQKELNLTLTPRPFGTVAKVSSYLNIPRTGLYRFHLTACDGGKLIIDGHQVAAQPHFRSNNPVAAWVLLEKGKHAVVMMNYRDTPLANPHELSLKLEGPGIPLASIPDTAWEIPGDLLPAETIELTATVGKGVRSNYVTFKTSNFTGDRAALEKISLTNKEGETWATLDLDRADSSSPIFLPEGDHVFFPRLFLKNNIVVNVEPISFQVKNQATDKWTISDPGPLVRRPLGVLEDKDRLILMGDTTRSVTREITGDFVFGMRVKEFVNALGPVKKTAYAGFGFTVTQGEKSPVFRWTYTPYYQGRYETPNKSHGGLTGDAWAASLHYISLPCLFRFARKGNVFKAVYKPNGGEWTTLVVEELAMGETLTIGPNIYQSHEPNIDEFYRVEFDQIKIAPLNH